MDEFTRRIMLAQSLGNLVLSSNAPEPTKAEIGHEEHCAALEGGQCHCDCDILITDAGGRVLRVEGDGSTIVLSEPMRPPGEVH